MTTWYIHFKNEAQRTSTYKIDAPTLQEALFKGTREYCENNSHSYEKAETHVAEVGAWVPIIDWGKEPK